MPTYTCPTKPVPYLNPAYPGETCAGCGTTFEDEPDDDGCVDCPECGIWFDPNNPDSIPGTPEELAAHASRVAAHNTFAA